MVSIEDLKLGSSRAVLFQVFYGSFFILEFKEMEIIFLVMGGLHCSAKLLFADSF